MMKFFIALCVSVVAYSSVSFALQKDVLVYQKGETFLDTLLSTQAEYNKWVKRNAKDNSVTFGKWYVSNGINPAYKKVLSAINPFVKPFDVNETFVRRPLWNAPKLQDATIFNLHRYNFKVWDSIVFHLTREITAKTPCKKAITVGYNGDVSVWLNGKEVGAVKAGTKVFTLDLSAGKNTLLIIAKSLKIASQSRGSFYFAPYDDPAIEASKNLAKDYAENFKLIDSIKWSEVSDNMVAIGAIASKDNRDALEEPIKQLIEASRFSAGKFERQYKALFAKTDAVSNTERVKLFANLILTLRAENALGYDIENLTGAMNDIKKNNPAYDADGAFFAELRKYRDGEYASIKRALLAKDIPDADTVKKAEHFKAFADKALLANPLLKQYPRWVYVKRNKNSYMQGLPANWQGNQSMIYCCGQRYDHYINSFKDELWTFDMSNPRKQERLFKPENGNIISDLDVSFDGKKILYSSVDNQKCFQLFELDTENGKTRKITPSVNQDVDNYDGIYLPDGRIIFCSTACWVGVPCVDGVDHVGNLYILDPNAGDENAVDKSIRQLTFEQDADWMPTLMENGRVMYTRWEYVDNSHYFSRILMHMNPDGTAQSSLYGSVSYWPNSLFYTRQVPNDPNKFVSIVTGHHGTHRSGELHMFDISKGTKEEQGRVHKFPTYGREFVPELADELVRGKFPQILHPYPLSENYIIASVRMPASAQAQFGIYLIDKFDNMTPITALDSDDLAVEPMPLVARKVPTEISDRTNPDIDYGYVFLNDIYQGEGLKDVPRGTVKALRVFEYHYAYRYMGSSQIIANEGSWDVKRIHGTVPVEKDGSALFKVPANRPIAIQPLDKDGKALALMRSWFTVMPGETQSCVGCHEGQGMSPTSKPALAGRKKPSIIKPFLAPVRGYSFKRDVQPILDQYCVGCHNGARADIPNFSRGEPVWKTFPKAYLELQRYVRRGGPECNQNMLIPMEFNANTSELFQMLKKGHKGVKLDKTSMDVLYTWLDLNVPCVGTWGEVKKDIPQNGAEMRKKYLAKYANRHDDQEAIVYDGGVREFVAPKPQKSAYKKTGTPRVSGFPFDSVKAEKMRDSVGLPKELSADLGDGVQLRLTLVPAGAFVMGTNDGYEDEAPARVVQIKKPFYMGQFEITNAQYAKFDPSHNSGHYDRQMRDHINRGYPANTPDQPVVRVNWNQAVAYCDWLTKKFGVKFSLPNEPQWEWAARAGTNTPFWFGNLGVNYGDCENLSDYTVKDMNVDGFRDPQPRAYNSPYDDIQPRDDFAYDAQLVSSKVGMFKPNVFGLYDMIGNVAEWTSNAYTPTLGGKAQGDRKVVRGGSWRDRAKVSRVTMRRDYHKWQKVYNVGFRVVVDDVKVASELLKPAKPLPQYKQRSIIPPVDTMR